MSYGEARLSVDAARSCCLFCRIIGGESPSEMVYQDMELVAFRDKFPKTPTHILIVPRVHIPSLADLKEEQVGLVARMVMLANRLAREHGIAEEGYRLTVNCGPWGGQAVPHLHFHLMGGRPMAWERQES